MFKINNINNKKLYNFHKDVIDKNEQVLNK